MAISKIGRHMGRPAIAIAALSILVSAPAVSRELASPSTCQALAGRPPIAGAKAAVGANPDSVQAIFALADAWSDAGCFNDAVQTLQGATATHPANKELDTRLRVAKSLVGEEHYFDNLDRADKEAQLKRATFRCTSLGDVDACDQSLQQKPDDPTLLVAQGDALLRARRPADALTRYRLAAVIAPRQNDVEQKISAVESQLPAGAGTALGSPLGATTGSGANAATSQRATPLRVATTAVTANTATTATTSDDARSTRRYSNAAPDSHTH